MGIFSQTAGSTYKFWVNPVNFTLPTAAAAPARALTAPVVTSTVCVGPSASLIASVREGVAPSHGPQIASHFKSH
jgi:hypothetical protein